MFARGSGAGSARARNRRGRVGARVAGLGVTALVAVMALSGCSLGSVGSAFKGFGWPEGGVSDRSHRMYDLWVGSVIAALVVGVLVWGLIFWCVIRYRKRGEELPLQVRYNLPIEFLYTVLPFLVIAVLFYYTATTQSYVDKISKNPDVKVEVVAFKWNWQFRYLDANAAGADGQAISTIGTSDYVPVLVVPTNKSILFYETSKDVIHSFWVPDLLFKRDVFPGNVENKFQVTVDKEGSYVGRCAELCGAYHSMMNFEMRAVTPEKYERFIAARKQGMSTPEALQSIGEKAFATTTTPFPYDQQQRAAS
ncbi:aa3-type cytochrome oxidase subunit II [Planosporangium mesophilum]|uniref:cytochrome-c oxidase n=1 Tax=Planosporangium mesophilum TaxID=689768 RepID=A0A8J3TBQ8_9ACTN|nr:cytochrome c oxidase subunit II [Planosporangium mesophilum]